MIRLDGLKGMINRRRLKDADSLTESLQKLEVAIKRLERTNALVELSRKSNPYRALVLVMSRLNLIDWPI